MAAFLAGAGCGSDPSVASSPTIAVLAAFPAELGALLERAEVHETLAVGDRTVRLATIEGVPVVLAMTGIGLVNAETTTRLVLARFDVKGVVMSGVAGSTLRIGDVAVPEEWVLADGTSRPVHSPWLELSRRLAQDPPPLERCTSIPSSGEPVCLDAAPRIVPGGVGESDDPFGGDAFRCQPTGDDVFGCDVGAPLEGRFAEASPAPVAVDMESAAVAREAAARGLPFIAFRAVSDGEGDPLGLPGFPAQFFAYYRLAANNAAAATAGFIGLLERSAPLRSRPS